MERRKFAREFKLEAVKLIKERGVSYIQAARDLGVHESVLRNWVKALADDPAHAFRGHGQMKPEQAEIARLKREVTRRPDNWVSRCRKPKPGTPSALCAPEGIRTPDLCAGAPAVILSERSRRCRSGALALWEAATRP